MKKDIFFVGELCRVVNVKKLNNGFSEIYTEPIKNGVFFFKDDKYIDIDTNISYTSDVYADTKYFIKTSSLIPWIDYLKQHKINYDNSNMGKQHVKYLYKKINDNKRAS